MDNERYNEIVTTYSPMVYRIALHDCRNHADAEDVMQNVFLRLYRFAPEFQSEEHLRRWLIQVTVRESVRLFAKPFRKREALLEELHPGTDTLVSGSPADLTTEEGVLADVLCSQENTESSFIFIITKNIPSERLQECLGKRNPPFRLSLRGQGRS